MKPESTSTPSFDKNAMRTALEAAPDMPINDPENPPTSPEEWTGVVISHSFS